MNALTVLRIRGFESDTITTIKQMNEHACIHTYAQARMYVRVYYVCVRARVEGTSLTRH